MTAKFPRIILAAAALIAWTAQSACAEASLFAPDAISIKNRATFSPGFSPDGMTAYYTQSACDSVTKCPQHLHVSEYRDGAWTLGQRINRLGDDRVDWPSVTPDGKRLILTWTAPRPVYAGLDIITNFDLFTLDLTSETAMPVAIEGADINRPRAGRLKTRRAFHVQSAGTLTERGDLYFWDEREDAIGERDIFVARADQNGGFEPAQALPAPINSKGRDHHSWVSPKGGLMLVSYPGRGGLGNDDIFVSRKLDGVWTAPTSLGPAINSRASDFAARLTPDGKAIVFTSDRSGPGRSAGLYQIWQVASDDLIAAGTLWPEDLTR